MTFFFCICQSGTCCVSNCFYSFIQNEVQCYRMITCFTVFFFSETEEHFTAETAVSNMAALTASCNTHHDKLSATSSSTPKLRIQPQPQLTTACKKATKTKK